MFRTSAAAEEHEKPGGHGKGSQRVKQPLRRGKLGKLRGIELHATPHGCEGITRLADAEP